MYKHNKFNYKNKKSLKIDRIIIFKILVIFLTASVVLRLFGLQVLNYDKYNEKALKRYSRTLVIPAERGEIFLKDDSGEYNILATNTTFDLLYIDPIAFEDRFYLTRDLVLKGKLSINDFSYASFEEYVDEVSVKVAEIVGLKPAEVKANLTRKYNDHIALLYEPSDDIVFLLEENPINGVYVVNEYDEVLDEIKYESDEYKFEYVNRLTPEEKDEMRAKVVEIYIDPTEIVSEVSEEMPEVARKVLYEQNQKKAAEIAKEIYKIIPDYSLDDLQRILVRKFVRYQPIMKKLSLEESKAVKNLGYYGLVLQPENYRLYPENQLLANVLGFVDKQGVGRYSLEGQYDIYLKGMDGYKVLDVDNLGNQITVGDETTTEPVSGQDIVLTVNRSIQQHVETVLKETVDAFRAKGGQVVVMNPKTGAIMAMASYPTYNPNEFYRVYEKDEETDEYLNKVGPEAFYNPAVASVYEPGSTYKIFTVAKAIDSGEFLIDERVCDDNGKAEIKVGNRTYVIQNASLEAHGCMTLSELLEKSSNIGALKVSLRIGAGVFRTYMKNFGFSEFTDIGFEDENNGYIKDIKEWGKVMLANAGFGQGFTVTPIQLVTAAAAIANQGKLMRPYIVAEKHIDEKVIKTEPLAVRRVVMPLTAQRVTDMMVSVVDRGLGGAAAIPGYSVAGKTGTSQVSRKEGGYSTKNYITSFLGFAPANDPEFVMLVKIDYPQSQRYGSIVAAPAFSKIGSYILKSLEVPKDR